MEYLKKNRFFLFLVLLLSNIIVTSFIIAPHRLELCSTINYTLILISGLYAFSTEKNFFRITSTFFLISIILDWLQYFTIKEILNTIQPLFTSIVLVLLLVMTLRSIRASRVVNQNVIFGVVSGYVLIGFIGALVAMALSYGYTDAFTVPGKLDYHSSVYFSFVTMTTLGYGDISPSIPQSRSLAVLLSIMGPMYVAIIVALMVGKFSSGKESE